MVAELTPKDQTEYSNRTVVIPVCKNLTEFTPKHKNIVKCFLHFTNCTIQISTI